MAKKESLKSSVGPDMPYSHQIYWYVVVILGVSGVSALIPPDIDTIIRVDIAYFYFLGIGLSGLFVFRNLIRAKSFFIIFNFALIFLGVFFLKPYNDKSLIHSAKSDLTESQNEILSQIASNYRHQVDEVLEEGTELKRPKHYDGNYSYGAVSGHLNRSGYPKLANWRNSLAEKIPKVYSIYFDEEKNTDEFYRKYVMRKNYDPAGHEEKYIGNLFNTTFESLKFLRDNPLFYLRLENIHR